MHASVMMTVTTAAPAAPGPACRQLDYPEDQHHRRDQFRALAFDAPPHEERAKKPSGAKWSLGKLFRRKKKEDDSGSSSNSDEGISTRSETKKKKKRKRPAAVSVANFDHIVVNREGRRAQSVLRQNTKDAVDEGVLSDPSAGFVGYRGRHLPQGTSVTSKESLHPRDDSGTRSCNTSMDGSVRRGRKGRMMARVEALRNSMRKDSSSDEESQKSSTSSSMIRFRSDDSLINNSHSRDGSVGRRSRSARTERYIKRLSRDEENQLNKEAELLQQGYSKAEVEMLTRTPTSQSSGYGTSKREVFPNKPENIYSNDPNRRPAKSESVSSFPSTHSYPSSINFNAKVNNESINYSIPYVRNDKEPMYVNQMQDPRYQRQSMENDNVVCVKFPLGNVTNIARDEKAPPVPPPRDLLRKVATPVSMMEAEYRNRNEADQPHGVPNNDFQRIMRRSQERSLNPTINGLRRPISNSEDHIAMEINKDPVHYPYLRKPEQPRRPASVSVESDNYGLYANAPWRNKLQNGIIIKPEPVKQDFLYYADQSPRSRRPISIQTSQTNLEKQCFSDSQSSLQNQYPNNNSEWSQRRPRNASEFWRKIDDEECKRKSLNAYPLSRALSETSTNTLLHSRLGMQMNTRHDHIIPRFSQANDSNSNNNRLTIHNTSRDVVDGSQRWKSATEYNRTEIPRVLSPPQRTHVRHKSETINYKSPSDDEKSSERRKSTNLDDALNELEAIYNSLGLGDEDLLDRAERRELMSPRSRNVFNDWNGNDDMIRKQSSPLRKHPIPRRSTLPDKLQDDMAFRRMNSKDKPITKDSPTSQISYMLASPAYVPYVYDDGRSSEGDHREPDIVQDDVVYRNIKHANNHLKVVDPQPPFGIPVGPVTPAPLSDYLHATPENKSRSRFIPRRSPDLVQDDLAYRALRKDNRHSSLFEDYERAANNNYSYNEPAMCKDSAILRKKRAVRSLSANIFSMIQKEIDDALNMSKEATLQKTQSITDVNKRLANGNNPESPRNKVKHRHNTVNIVVSSTPGSSYSKDDAFISDDRHLGKPPCGDKSKSSSPNRSPQPAKKSGRDEFQHVLTMLAQEAMDTSNKLGVALAELDKNRNSNTTNTENNRNSNANGDKVRSNNKREAKSDRFNSSQARAQFLSSLSNNKSNSSEHIHEHKLPNIHSVHDTKPTVEPRCESVITNTGKKTEDSLLAISDQLHKVEDKLKHSFERIVTVPDESLKLSVYIAEPEEKLKAQECRTSTPESKPSPVILEPKIQEDATVVKALSPIPTTNTSQDKIDELNEMKSFNDLKEGISDLLAGITQVNDKLFKGKANSDKSDESKRSSVTMSVYEDDLAKDTTEYNSSEELATIFKLEKPDTEIAKIEEDKHSELHSPRLVQCANQQLRRSSDDCTDQNDNNERPSQNQSKPSVPWRTKKRAEPGNRQGDN